MQLLPQLLQQPGGALALLVVLRQLEIAGQGAARALLSIISALLQRALGPLADWIPDAVFERSPTKLVRAWN